MEFRRTGHRDERRRRVLIEERRGATIRRESAGAKTRRADSHDERSTNGCQGYALAAIDSKQPPVTCLIPKRPWTLTVLVLSGLTVHAAVHFLYTNVYLAATASQRAVLGALDVAGQGSLGGWCSSLFLLVAAAASFMAYAIRRHRLDDYRGRYRIWLWSLLFCTLAGIDTATGLHRALSYWLVEVTQTRLYGDGSIWWMLVFAVIFGGAILRLTIEMRGSLMAIFALLWACTGYVAGCLLELRLLLDGWGVVAELLQSTSVMAAHLSIALAVLWYCRHIHRQAHAELSDEDAACSAAAKEAPRRPRVKSRRKDTSVRIDAAHDTPKKKAQADTDSEQILAEFDEREERAEQRTMSKSERRRLRKENRRNRRSA
jgi:hypothetical protein